MPRRRDNVWEVRCSVLLDEPLQRIVELAPEIVKGLDGGVVAEVGQSSQYTLVTTVATSGTEEVSEASNTVLSASTQRLAKLGLGIYRLQSVTLQPAFVDERNWALPSTIGLEGLQQDAELDDRGSNWLTVCEVIVNVSEARLQDVCELLNARRTDGETFSTTGSGAGVALVRTAKISSEDVGTALSTAVMVVTVDCTHAWRLQALRLARVSSRFLTN